MTASPDGPETASTREGPRSRLGDERPSGGPKRPVRRRGEQSAWDKAFEAENERRRRADQEAERLMSQLDLEPGRPNADPHELVWVTPEIALCPQCEHTYKRARLPNKEGRLESKAQSAYDRDSYIKSCGLFQHAGEILAKRQAERKTKEQDTDAKRRAKKPAGHR